MASMSQYLAHNLCNIVCIVEEKFVMWKNNSYVFYEFSGDKFGFLYDNSSWGVEK